MAYGYKIYFTERAKNRVICWNPDTGKSSVAAGESANGDPEQKLRDPYGLTIDADGRLLIADKLHHRICRLNRGRLERLTVRDADGHRAGVRGPHREHPLCPTALFCEPDGALLCAYSDDHTIYRVHPDGRLELVLGIPPSQTYVYGGCRERVPGNEAKQVPLHTPTAVVRRKDGTMFFVERGYQVVREYHSRRGLRSLFSIWGVAPLRRGDAIPTTVAFDAYRPVYPTALALDKEEKLYLTDAAQQAVWQMDFEASVLRLVARVGETPETSGGGPSAAAFGPDGTLWVVDTGQGSVCGLRRGRGGRWAPVNERLATARQRGLCSASEGAGVCCGKVN